MGAKAWKSACIASFVVPHHENMLRLTWWRDKRATWRRAQSSRVRPSKTNQPPANNPSWPQTHEGAQPRSAEPGSVIRNKWSEDPDTHHKCEYCLKSLNSKVVCLQHKLILSLGRPSWLEWILILKPFFLVLVKHVSFSNSYCLTFLPVHFLRYFAVTDEPAQITLNYWLLTLSSPLTRVLIVYLCTCLLYMSASPCWYSLILSPCFIFEILLEHNPF